jgi:hypothetical protein
MNISNVEALVWVLPNMQLVPTGTVLHDHSACVKARQVNSREAELSMKSIILA